MFFCNSLRFRSLKAPTPIAEVRSWTAFTPYYSEDVKYRLTELTARLEDEKTLFSLIVATFAEDFDNFKERIGALGKDDEVVLLEHWPEAQTWASDRTQSLARCVRGVCLYGSAMRLLARLEGHDDETAERMARGKFEFLVSAQIFGKQRGGARVAGQAQGGRHRGADPRTRRLEGVLRARPAGPHEGGLRVVPHRARRVGGACRVEYKVKLPGNPIVGEGKPENQNQAVICARRVFADA